MWRYIGKIKNNNFFVTTRGAFNYYVYYVLIKWPNFRPPLPVRTCSILVTPLPRTFKTLRQPRSPYKHTLPPPQHYPAVTKTIDKSCYFIDSWTPIMISAYKCDKTMLPWCECSAFSFWPIILQKIIVSWRDCPQILLLMLSNFKRIN